MLAHVAHHPALFCTHSLFELGHNRCHCPVLAIQLIILSKLKVKVEVSIALSFQCLLLLIQDYGLLLWRRGNNQLSKKTPKKTCFRIQLVVWRLESCPRDQKAHGLNPSTREQGTACTCCISGSPLLHGLMG